MKKLLAIILFGIASFNNASHRVVTLSKARLPSIEVLKERWSTINTFGLLHFSQLTKLKKIIPLANNLGAQDLRILNVIGLVQEAINYNARTLSSLKTRLRSEMLRCCFADHPKIIAQLETANIIIKPNQRS